MEQRPTKKQRELLSFIDGFIKGYGYGPSYREIMRALDYKSVSTVATHVNGLITRGWLVKKDNSARTLEVLHPGETVSHEVGTVANTAEQALLKKIDELRGVDNDAHAKDIATLTDALRILGYDTGDGKTIV
jgi:SOS-response transcriptional repressor LexA